MSLPDFSTLNTGSDGAAAFAKNDSPTSGGAEADQPATATPEPTGDLPGPSRRPMLSKRASFWVLAGVVLLAFAANAAASPLYRVYQARFGFSVTTLTLLFAVYVLAVLATLLVLGSLSDYVGRRGMVLAGLVAGAAGCGLFLIAHGVGVLYAARALQGVAQGLIWGAASAALLDLRPDGGVAPLVSSTGPTGGQALGAIAAGALAQYAVAPTHLVWWLLLGGFILGVLAVLAMPEPGTTRRGALSSLRPHVNVPRQARGAFAAAVPALVGVWALVGFYNSLGPSLAAQLLHSKNLLWGALLIFLLGGFGAALFAVLGDKDPSAVMLGGCVALIAGVLVTFGAIETRTPTVLFVGTAVAGLGFGPTFLGAYRSTVALAPSGARAGLITAIYVVSFLALSIPAVIGGIATSHYGLHDTALVYSVVVAALIAVALCLLIRRLRNTRDRRRLRGGGGSARGEEGRHQRPAVRQ